MQREGGEAEANCLRPSCGGEKRERERLLGSAQSLAKGRAREGADAPKRRTEKRRTEGRVKKEKEAEGKFSHSLLSNSATRTVSTRSRDRVLERSERGWLSLMDDSVTAELRSAIRRV